MSEPHVLLNGRLLPRSLAHLALNDAGFVFGATATDLCRTVHGRLYRWPDHRDRFRASGAAIHVDVPTAEQLDRWAVALIRMNQPRYPPRQEQMLVMFATPGPIGYYFGEPGGIGDDRPTFGMHTFPLPYGRYRKLIVQGADLVIPEIPHVPGACVDRRVKQRSRLHWWLAEVAAKQIRPGAQALLVDETGGVTETAAANFLAVVGATVVSPPADRVLGGVSLSVVRELCGTLGIPFAERRLTPADCHAASEALLTSTPYGLVGVRRIDDVVLPWPGPVAQRLRLAWNAAVGLDLHRQIRDGAS